MACYCIITRREEDMKRAWMGLVLGLALAGATSSAQADWTESWNSFWGRCELDYLRNTHWPQPFIYPDRDAVRAPFAAMVVKGWQRQNTLGDYHFDTNTHQLNRAGELRLRAIATIADPERRTVFVYRGATQDITATRIDSVQRYASYVVVQGEMPVVVDTGIPPVERPGDVIDQIQTRAISNMPNPVLPPYEAAGAQGQ
jgi:hypothetical protein